MESPDVVALLALFEEHGIEVHLDGGWAVDALLGAQTRPHSDLDVALRHQDVPLLRELLAARGYRAVARQDTWEHNFVLGDDAGRLLDVHSYLLGPAGTIERGVPYPPGSLTGTGRIAGVAVRCVEPGWLVRFHSGYELRDEDRRDVRALCARFGLPLPDGYEPADWAAVADTLAAGSLAAGDPTGWFERLYAGAGRGEVEMPWNRDAPHPALAEWAAARALAGAGADGRRATAVVVGAGLGADAEFVAGLGFDTTAFDISGTALELARGRHPGSAVDYVTADLFDLPASWRHAFDLVVEIHTVQAMPESVRVRAIAGVAGLVAPGGTLLVISAIRDGDEIPVDPPWPLTRAAIDSFATDGLRPVLVERLAGPQPRWRAELHRPRVQRADLGEPPPSALV